MIAIQRFFFCPRTSTSVNNRSNQNQINDSSGFSVCGIKYLLKINNYLCIFYGQRGICLKRSRFNTKQHATFVTGFNKCAVKC